MTKARFLDLHRTWVISLNRVINVNE